MEEHPKLRQCSLSSSTNESKTHLKQMKVVRDEFNARKKRANLEDVVEEHAATLFHANDGHELTRELNA